MKCSIGSLYICVKDMKRAIAFYEDFFGRMVTESDEIYSVFDIGGFRFGLFAYQTVGEKHSFGDNCLPSISTENANVLKEKLAGKEMCFPLKK